MDDLGVDLGVAIFPEVLLPIWEEKKQHMSHEHTPVDWSTWEVLKPNCFIKWGSLQIANHQRDTQYSGMGIDVFRKRI